MDVFMYLYIFSWDAVKPLGTGRSYLVTMSEFNCDLAMQSPHSLCFLSMPRVIPLSLPRLTATQRIFPSLLSTFSPFF